MKMLVSNSANKLKPKPHQRLARIIENLSECSDDRDIDLPSGSLLIIVDVSGSYFDYAVDVLLPAVKYAKRNIDVDVILFDDEVRINPPFNQWNGGGGTRILPVIAAVQKLGGKKNYSAILMVSDYEFADSDITKKDLEKIFKRYGEKVILEDWLEDEIRKRNQMNMSI